jgi:hypothetical protein
MLQGQPRQKDNETTSQPTSQAWWCAPSYTGGTGRKIKVQGRPMDKNSTFYLKTTKAKKGWGHDLSNKSPF